MALVFRASANLDSSYDCDSCVGESHFRLAGPDRFNPKERLNMRKIIGIVAMTNKRIIGDRNRLPWPTLQKDLQYFKDMTWGHPVLMGYNTMTSLPAKRLPGRLNLILSGTIYPDSESSMWVKDLEDIPNVVDRWVSERKPALFSDWAVDNPETRALRRIDGNTDLFIVGGSSVYFQTLDLMDQLHVTRVLRDYPGDKLFPEFEEKFERVHMNDKHKGLIFEIWNKSVDTDNKKD